MRVASAQSTCHFPTPCPPVAPLCLKSSSTTRNPTDRHPLLRPSHQVRVPRLTIANAQLALHQQPPSEVVGPPGGSARVPKYAIEMTRMMPTLSQRTLAHPHLPERMKVGRLRSALPQPPGLA